MKLNENSWRIVPTHSVVQHEKVDKIEDLWKVDRHPPIGTRTVKVSYGEIKVFTCHGKK